ncbi:Dipeptide-binding ABC transporter [Pseudomonas amygdali pv. sesami]|nr:Dipeptide-binding ABC transporter [Pseudomonas amygdali pv. sesami]
MGHTLFKPLLLTSALLACAPLAQAASTLVYCSEASPAGFDPVSTPAAPTSMPRPKPSSTA